jgi:hypothetical protein
VPVNRALFHRALQECGEWAISRNLPLGRAAAEAKHPAARNLATLVPDREFYDRICIDGGGPGLPVAIGGGVMTSGTIATWF